MEQEIVGRFVIFYDNTFQISKLILNSSADDAGLAPLQDLAIFSFYTGEASVLRPKFTSLVLRQYWVPDHGNFTTLHLIPFGTTNQSPIAVSHPTTIIALNLQSRYLQIPSILHNILHITCRSNCQHSVAPPVTPNERKKYYGDDSPDPSPITNQPRAHRQTASGWDRDREFDRSFLRV